VLNILNRNGTKARTFQTAIAEIKDTTTRVLIFEKKGLRGRFLSEISLQDAQEMATSPEMALLETFGGGDYGIKLCDKTGGVLQEFSFSIAGAPKGRTREQRESGDEGEKKVSGGNGHRQNDELLTMAINKLADAAVAGKVSAASEFQHALELAKTLNDSGSGDREMMRDLVSSALTGLLSKGGDSIDDAMRLIELSQKFAPKIEKQDTWDTIIQGLMPAFASIISARMGGQQISPANLAELQAQLGQAQQHVNQLVEVETPGQRPTSPNLAGTPTSAPAHQVEPAKIVESTNAQGQQEEMTEQEQRYVSFEVMMLNPLAHALEAGKDAKFIAALIVTILNNVDIFTSDDPHPVIRELYEGVKTVNVEKMSSGFDSFAKELGMSEEVASAVKAELVSVYKDVFMKTKESEK